ncbi:MAG: hypothetical protein DRP65_02775 [Planctomycetota bacterium]|nr:MAG: hypothetical protein DRP65_02775 [Planctomycetota bacterium]
MMSFLAQIIAWLNVPLNAAGRGLTVFVAAVPGWLSITVISAVMGVILLILWKYTSNQDAIGRVKDNIKANLLAMRLFKDSISVTLKAQGEVFRGAVGLLFHAIRPLLVVIVPICLIMAQMALWYQARPLLPGEEALVIMQLNGDIDSAWPDVSIASIPAADVTIDQTRAFTERQIYWKIKARKNGLSNIIFQVDNEQVKKQLAVGEGFMRVSIQRPGWHWSDILLHPSERPFSRDSVVQSISIEYPDRLSLTSGTGWWLIYFFVASMVFAFIFKPFLNVKI